MKKMLWFPSEKQIKETNMARFIEFVNTKYDKCLKSYSDLYDWSITDIPEFWAAMWEFGGIKFSKTYNKIVNNLDDMLGTKWFPGSRLNFAENLLRYRDDQTALIFKSEALEPVRISYAQLYDQVARLARSLRDLGVTAGDRVAGFMPNMRETIIAMLATTSIGAVWSSCSPDFGIQGV